MTADPDITTFPLSPQHEFLLLACDGMCIECHCMHSGLMWGPVLCGDQVMVIILCVHVSVQVCGM